MQLPGGVDPSSSDAALLRSLAPRPSSRSSTSSHSSSPTPLSGYAASAAAADFERDALAAAAADPLRTRPAGFGPASGPKAVRADAAWEALTVARVAERRELQARSHPAANFPEVPGDANLAHAPPDDDADDASFLAAHRSARLAALRAAAAPPLGPYGTLRVLATADGFLDTVDGAPPGVLVLVLLYEEWAPGCEDVLPLLSGWAASHPTTLCAAMKSSAASESFDVVALPAVLAYRGGALLGSVLRVGRGAAGFVAHLETALATDLGFR